MRLAVLSDIHGNLAALEAVLADAARRGIDGTVHLGDLVGWGPEPGAVVDRVQTLGLTGVAGNWDLAAAHPDPDGGWQRYLAPVAPAAAREALDRTRAELTPGQVEFLRGLPAQLRIEEGDQTLVLAHASPENPCEALGSHTPEERLRALFEGTGAEVLVVGHTHLPLARELAPWLLLNPGSVGRPDPADPRASYLVLDTEHGFTAQHVRVEFPVETKAG